MIKLLKIIAPCQCVLQREINNSAASSAHIHPNVLTDNTLEINSAGHNTQK